ncbi:MAG TPA: malto-oligosyltrehalose synthase [Dyella sp.]|uniref:malto-oligosyltrehalose synthase n=1 Tax=Dyella sp. TaxID=1869338 RepID=UPI002F932E97
MTELLGTARLQLHRGFDLHAAAAQVPYFARLGISHLYLSPIASARTGSTHGYDVIDPGTINPELGGEAAFMALAEALHRHGMGAILDIVPNHMAADTANPWWRDVLEHGRGSRYADYFDIEWDAPDTDGRLWLPILGDRLDALLSRGELSLRQDVFGTWELAYGELRLPLSPQSRQWLRDDGLMPGTLQRVLDMQHYRLAWWRSSRDAINYRRFFDIDGLVALAMNSADVFEAVHALPLRLLAQGLIDGLRIDHIDGIARPRWYLRRLRRAMDEARRVRGSNAPLYLYVEKILASQETLSATWPVDGSTGYDFMDRVGALLHDTAGQHALARYWQRLTNRGTSFRHEEQQARREWLDAGLRTDLERCTRQWRRYLAELPEYGDLTVAAVERAIGQLLERLAVYRTYLGPGKPSRADRHALLQAFELADAEASPDDRDARAWLRKQLLEVDLQTLKPPQRRCLRRARQRLEQLAAPLNAKAAEDTAFYRYGVLLSRNEVGSDPEQFALSVDGFHRAMEQRATRFATSLSATATHDHKRGEDTRARLALLSEDPSRWTACFGRWIEELQRQAPGPDVADMLMLLQIVLAAWPLHLTDDDEALAAYGERLETWWIKALREARLRTCWTTPDIRYEARAQALVRRLFGDPALAGLRQEIGHAAHRLDAPGALNGLAMTTLRLTAPGVPDLYQGTEFWDQSLVDPDNRRNPDYAARNARLGAVTEVTALLADFRSGSIKQALIAALLALRRRAPELMRHGDYRPCRVTGAAIGHALAFERHYRGQHLLVAVPRLCAGWLAQATEPRVPAACWGDATVLASENIRQHDLVNVLTNQTLPSMTEQTWQLSNLWAAWPVTVLLAGSQALR